MDIQLTNTLSKRKEVFEPIHKGKVGIYSCGPTVYSTPTIGNWRTFIYADILRRIFEDNGYEVRHVMNITDVGHLTDDGSDGDDKLEEAAEIEGKTAWDIAKHYTQEYLRDRKRLHLKDPQQLPKATEHVAQQISMIEDLEKNGFAYTIRDGVYFDTSKMEGYGRLGGQLLEEKEEGARVKINSEKRNPTDFALWKLSPEGKKRHMEWDSPWGIGFPGWHIECSAMSQEYLDTPFDIHTGGIDLIPVHHTNEIAQSKGATGQEPVKYWVHNEFLMVDGGRMGKSLGNAYSIDDIIERGFDPLAYRYFVMNAHYRTKQNFTWEALEAAQNALNNLRDYIWMYPACPMQENDVYVKRWKERVNDDMDMPGALSVLWELVRDPEVDGATKMATLFRFDNILGFHLEDEYNAVNDLSADVRTLLEERKAVRENHDWEASDRLRDALLELGFVVEDKRDGQHIRPRRS